MDDILYKHFRHYKGGLYYVEDVATHTETEGDLVLYIDVSKPDKLWARPKDMFLSSVDIDGQQVRRFRPIEDGEYVPEWDRKLNRPHDGWCHCPSGESKIRWDGFGGGICEVCDGNTF